MNPRTLLLGVAALVAAGVTALLIQGWLDRQRASLAQRPAPAAVKMAENSVLVAKKRLPAGHLIRPGDLDWLAWPAKGIASTFLVRGKNKMNDFMGAVVRRGIDSHTPITEAAIVKPGDRGFLAAVLTPGKRAIAVPVSAATVIAGLVFPGDHVDLILSHKYQIEVPRGGKKGGVSREIRQASETVLNNLRVLAVDQTTDDLQGKRGVPRTVTLEVSPKQAEMVTLALNLGKLSLSLRSLAKSDEGTGDKAPVNRHTITRDNEVSRLIGINRRATSGRFVTVLRGSKSETSAVEGAGK